MIRKFKPIHRRVVVGLPIQRIPDSGALNPRLQPEDKRHLPSAIGFTARVVGPEDDE